MRPSTLVRLNSPGLVCSNITTDDVSRPSSFRPSSADSSDRSDDVEVTVAVEVARLRIQHAGHFAQMMMRVRIGALVLQPLHGVIRFGTAIERVTIGVQHVQVTVFVQIDQLESRSIRTPDRAQPRSLRC